MARPAEPTQSDVLRERFSRVPWRRAFRDAIRAKAGRGPMVRPDRLEGAVYGQLLASDRGPDTTRVGLLDAFDELLSGADGAEGHRPPSPDLALASALVLRDAPLPKLAASAAAIAAGVSGDPSTAASGVAYALVIRRLLDGERSRRSARAKARRDAIAAGPATLHAEVPAMFETAWQVFDQAHDPHEALARAAALSRSSASAAAIVGGLAGARWGSSRLPAAWRGNVPSAARARRLIDRLIETDDPGRDGGPWQTSTSAPLIVHDLDLAGVGRAVPGRIGITPLPGRRYVAYHTGAQWRDPDTDAGRLRELGVDLLFLLVEDRELARCRVTDIESVLSRHDIDLLRYPIRDPLVPRDRAGFRVSVQGVLEQARQGRGVAIACRGGYDRAGMAAACLLREAGLDATTAIDRVQRARPGALTLPDQQAYVRAWPAFARA